MSLLCERYEDLAHQVERVKEGEDAELLYKVRSLRAEMGKLHKRLKLMNE
jgi:hypothetical protein